MVHLDEMGFDSSMSISNKPASTGRKGSKKVRTGCITCKIRKVKCDEVKPFCMRCTKTGRKCDGYLDRPARRNPGHPPHTSLLFIYEWASQDEKRSFHFFQHVTAPTLSGDFDAYFWRVLVLQICQTEPAVKHAVLAVSSLHEGMLQDSQSDARYADGSSRQSFALQQYNKAIACMLDLMREADIKPLSPLLTCLLFVCIEFMQSKDVESLNHLERGRRILSQLKRGTTSTNAEMDMIKRHLVPMYMRLSFTTFMFGGSPAPIPTELKMIKEIPSAFESIDDAQYCLYDFMDECMRFTKRTRHYKHIPDVPISTRRSLEQQQDRLLRKMGRFNVAYSLYRTLNPNNTPTSATTLLQIHLHLTSIWLSTALTNRETAFDDHLSTFSAIIPLASSFLDTATRDHSTDRRSSSGAGDSPPRNGRGSGFSFDMHVIAPLYYVITKCRHPLIRRAALDLLRRNPSRRENLWRANIMAAIAARHIKLEEHGAIQEGSISPLSQPQEPIQSVAPQLLWANDVNKLDQYQQHEPEPQDTWFDLRPQSLSDFPDTAAPVSMDESYQHSVPSLPGDSHRDSLEGPQPVEPTFLLDTVEPSSPHSFSSSLDAYPSDTPPHLPSHTPAMAWQPEPPSICLEPPTPITNLHYGPTLASSHPPTNPSAHAGSSSVGTNSDDEMPDRYPAPPQPVVKYSSRLSNEPPFDIPEHLRIQNTIIEEEGSGSWVVMFRKLTGLEGEWDAVAEFVVV